MSPRKADPNFRAKQLVLWFEEIGIADVPIVGGKNASLGEMYRHLTKEGVAIPHGFAITAEAYRMFITANKLHEKMKRVLKDLVVTDVKALAVAGKKIRDMIVRSPFPAPLETAILTSYANLSAKSGQAVAVRSSATAEDLPDASFAGQQESYLNVRGDKELLKAVKLCIASLFTDRAISYREAQGYDHLSIALSVTVQQMVGSHTGSSGVMFTLDTESGFNGVVLINASYGLGEYVVKGRVTPDQFYIFKEGLAAGKPAIFSRILGSKDVKLVYRQKGAGTEQQPVPVSERNRFSLSDDDVLTLAKWGLLIEKYYKKPQDIEWAKDGATGKLYIVQARPETVKSRSQHSVIERYELKHKGPVLTTGIAIGQKIGAGSVRVIDNPKDMKHFKKGEVLVTRITDPDWEPVMRLASAIVTEQGGKTSHAAIVSRELGVPCIVGVRNARKVLKDGQQVTASCAEGEEGVIYRGILPFELKRTEIKAPEKTKTKIMMNVGDPDNAFALSYLPHDGVGLAREEFIFTNFIRIHPLALIHFDRLKDRAAKRKIADITRGYKDKSAYCVDKLAEGMARIAVAFYPHDVIIRFSDFKTNEYATLIGGKEFEPKEENPMLGWRGASRYYSQEYKEGFRLECEAMKKVRDEWGLTNVIPMVPFCRTPEEGEKVLATMSEFGLKRGQNNLQVYVMCEIPSNVILAEEFASLFDGFSIGSNDLTQLALGVDRDSALVSHVYSEKNQAVMTLIRDVIRVAHKHKKKIGICGQAPSDHPDFAEFLVREGIDSISLNPDTIVATRERIAYAEKTIGKRGEKTSPLSVSLVTAVAVLAGFMVALGAGCADTPAERAWTTRPVSDISPAALRLKVEEKAAAERQAVEAAKTQALEESQSRIRETTFGGGFAFQYPSRWTVEHAPSEIILRAPPGSAVSSSVVRIYEDTKASTVADDAKQSVVVGGKGGLRYDARTADGDVVSVIELKLGRWNTLHIEGTGPVFETIVASFAFDS